MSECVSEYAMGYRSVALLKPQRHRGCRENCLRTCNLRTCNPPVAQTFEVGSDARRCYGSFCRSDALENARVMPETSKVALSFNVQRAHWRIARRLGAPPTRPYR